MFLKSPLKSKTKIHNSNYMPIAKCLIKCLEELKVKYKPLAHKTVYTAYDAATTLKAKLNEVAKSVHVVADKKHIIVVLPASHMLDLNKLKKILKAKKVEIAKEKLMTKVFKVKKGAVVPLQNLHQDAEVLVDKTFSKAKRVIMSAGTFEDSLEMKTKDFLKAVGGKLETFAKKK